jgi:hypothetical protein
LKEGENKDDKWITVTGSGKTKKLLKLKLKPTLHNAFAILSQPNDPTNYNMSGPPLQTDNNKTIIPPDPREYRRQRKIAQQQHISRRSGNCMIATTCSSTTALPLQRTNRPAWPKPTTATRNVWQSTLPTSSVAQQALVFPNVDAMRPTVWAPHSTRRLKRSTRTSMSVLPHTTKYIITSTMSNPLW